jgi:hypothetical protein
MLTTVSLPSSWLQGLTDREVQVAEIEPAIPDDALLGQAGRVARVWPSQRIHGLAVWQYPNWLLTSAGACRVDSPAAAEHTTLDVVLPDRLPSWIERAIPPLVRLCSLEPNWDSYGSPPPLLALVRRTLTLLSYAEVDGLPDPEIVPASGGGVQLEWYLEDRELEIEFMRDGRVEYLATDNLADRYYEDEARCIDDLRLWLRWVIHRA